MSRSSPSSELLVTQLRQQLILDQVLIMELEDQREEIAPQLEQTAQLLAEAQTLVEDKVHEAGHHAKVREDLQRQYEHLQHVQHVTNTALEEARDKLVANADQIDTLQKEGESQQALIKQFEADGKAKLESISKLETDLSALRDEVTRHITRIEQLDTERNAVKNSRSWRWTVWLRAIERRFQ